MNDVVAMNVCRMTIRSGVRESGEWSMATARQQGRDEREGQTLPVAV